MSMSEKHQKKGLKAFQTGDYEEAKTHFEAALLAAQTEGERPQNGFWPVHNPQFEMLSSLSNWGL